MVTSPISVESLDVIGSKNISMADLCFWYWYPNPSHCSWQQNTPSRYRTHNCWVVPRILSCCTLCSDCNVLLCFNECGCIHGLVCNIPCSHQLELRLGVGVSHSAGLIQNRFHTVIELVSIQIPLYELSLRSSYVVAVEGGCHGEEHCFQRRDIHRYRAGEIIGWL